MISLNSPKAFRCLLVSMAVLGVATWAVWLLTEKTLPLELKVYLNSRHSQIVSGGSVALLPLYLSLYLAVVLFVASLVGLYFFWRPARILYCGYLLVWVVEDLCLGPGVTTGSVAALGDMLSIVCGVVLYMVFFSPISERFK